MNLGRYGYLEMNYGGVFAFFHGSHCSPMAVNCAPVRVHLPTLLIRSGRLCENSLACTLSLVGKRKKRFRPRFHADPKSHVAREKRSTQETPPTTGGKHAEKTRFLCIRSVLEINISGALSAPRRVKILTPRICMTKILKNGRCQHGF